MKVTFANDFEINARAASDSYHLTQENERRSLTIMVGSEDVSATLPVFKDNLSKQAVSEITITTDSGNIETFQGLQVMTIEKRIADNLLEISISILLEGIA